MPDSSTLTRVITSECTPPAARLEPVSAPSTQFAQPVEPQLNPWKQQVGVFTSTFLTIFLAELGDKTQVTTLLMAAESHSPWVVFAGAGLALILTSLLGVSLGCWLAKRIPPRTLEVSAGILLLCISALTLWDVIQG